MIQFKFIIAIMCVVAGVGVTALVAGDSDTKIFLPSNEPTRDISVYPDYVTKGCHPAVAPNGTYYEVCN